MKILLFDIDGTLLLTGGAGKISFNKTFKELFGISNVWQGIDPGGKTDYLIIQELAQLALQRELDHREYEQVCKRYLEHFEEDLFSGIGFRLMPGIPELLKRLSAEKVLLGLATGNLEAAAWSKLERAGLRDYFSFGGFGSDANDRIGLTQKAVERGLERACTVVPPNHIYVIGDTHHDVAAGKHCGLQTVAVATGSLDSETLRGWEPHYLFQDFSDTDLVLKCFEF